MDQEQRLSINQLKKLNNEFDQQLRELGKRQSTASSLSWKKLAGKVILGIVGLLLPFVVLVRFSVFIYAYYQLNGWLALAIGCLATAVLLFFYTSIFIYRFGMSKRAKRYIIRGIILLVSAYVSYGVLYYSSLNTKTEEIRSYYRSLHPIVRIALTTVTLADSNIVVTDIERRPEDYQQMGLQKNEQSLHYMQPNGYIHAVDLRTKGRPYWKNWMFEYSFKLLGLSTMRHTGTADHLHIYLPLSDE